MNEKQQQLTFDKGITNMPSDNLCSDNTLAEAVGMVYDNGEHRVIQKPVLDFTVANGYHLVFVHNLPTTEKNYIFVKNGTLYYRKGKTGNFTSLDTTVPSPFSSQRIQAIGKTLIIATEEGLKYAVWKGSQYNTFDTIEDPLVRFWLWGRFSTSGDFSGGEIPSTTMSFNGIIGDNNRIVGGMQNSYNDAVVALYSANKKKACEAKRFVNPFFIRYALELYDGSYYKISQPILMLPSITHNSYMATWSDSGEDTDHNWKRMYTAAFLLSCSHNNNYEDLSDVVKNISVFATRQIDIYNTEATEQPLTVVDSSQVFHNGIYSYNNNTQADYKETNGGPSVTTKTFYKCFTLNTDLEKDLVSESVFYKIFELPIKGGAWHSDEIIKSHVLENLTTQPRLEYDDYYSHAPMVPSILYAYNNRLNAAELKRGFFDGFDFFTPFYFGEKDYTVYVRIKTDSGYKVVRKPITTDQVLSVWFYYPDRRADWVSIIDDDERCYLDAPLQEHTGLNGAYYFRGLPNSNVTPPTAVGATLSDQDLTDVDFESLLNQIATSEVNNPWVFIAAGYNSVSGRVLAMSTTTQALSQGQHGQYPLLVFTDSGIWAMSVDNTGLFQSIHPLSREVMIEGTPPIQTDGAVFFVSRKGLMVVGGAQVSCVSTQLSGKTNVFKDANNVDLVENLGDFNDYLQHAFIAYDYRDSLLWIFNPNTANTDRCYVYAIKSGTFSTFEFDRQISRVVNDYPDYLLQNTEGTVCSLLGRDNINDDRNDYTATLVSRPMKLENALALKSIMQIKHIHNLNTTAGLTFRMRASNNLRDWVELHSLRGTPWKYYQFIYQFSQLKACDTFSGSVLITQERRTNKLR